MLKLEVPSGSTRILLHSCCAPCSGAIIECMLQNGLRPTLFFSNANIYPQEEYEKRKAELVRYCDAQGLPTIDDDYNHREWLEYIRGLEREPERGARCMACFKYRLLRAARYAEANDFAVLTTSLASSRWKDLDQVNEAGEWACSQVNNVIWWPQNWRKGGLQPRRGEIIKEQNLYEQNWCGCEFSEKVAK